jgi:hypothetical protein
VKDDLLVDSHNIVNRWKNYFSQLLNVHRVTDVRQIEIHTAVTAPLPCTRFKNDSSNQLRHVIASNR